MKYKIMTKDEQNTLFEGYEKEIVKKFGYGKYYNSTDNVIIDGDGDICEISTDCNKIEKINGGVFY